MTGTTQGAAMQADLPAPPARSRRAGLWLIVITALALQAAVRREFLGLPLSEGASTLEVTSGNRLRRLSLGYEGLLADIYWTRAIQHFGTSRIAGDTRFEMLDPLLRITTTLDPHLIVAYRFGAIFLAERPPAGAGRPREAMQLLLRGVAANPDYWRFWEDLGFVEYWDLHDYPAAARYFTAGSQRPGAPIWMKTVAASVAAKGGEIETSRALWTQVYRSAANETVRQSALSHLAALKAAEDIRVLDQSLALYQKREGRAARSFTDLVAAGMLRGTPVDPTGIPYVVSKAGRVALSKASKINLALAE